jgi:DNA primase
VRDKPVRASRKTPCLICGGQKWPCSYLPDRSVMFCANVTSERMDSRRETYLHFDDARTTAPPLPVVKPSRPLPSVASVPHRHKVYSALLDRLPLSAHRFDNLLSRGLTPDVIARNGYKDTPTLEESDALAASLALLGLEGMAGFFYARGAWRLRWCRPGGFFCPYLDLLGRICGLMWRFDVPVGKAKYRWLSTDPEDRNDAGNIKFPKGASSRAPLHWARPELIASSPDIWLTEGSLKADVAAFLLNVPFVAAGGVSQWGNDFGERFKQKFPEHRAVIAYDRDWTSNVSVRRALESLMAQLSASRVPFIVRSWGHREEKGIDDLALALMQPKQRRAAA